MTTRLLPRPLLSWPSAIACLALAGVLAGVPAPTALPGGVQPAGHADSGVPVSWPMGAQACKPQAPIEMDLAVSAVSGLREGFDVSIELEPRLPVTQLRWSLQLPHGLRALEPTAGVEVLAVGERAQRTLRLEYSELSSSARAASVLGELSLTVEAEWPTSSGTARVSRRQALRFGDPESLPLQLQEFRNVESGARSKVMALPVSHRSGR